MELNLPVEELTRTVIRESKVSTPWENLEFSENFLLWKSENPRWSFIEIRKILKNVSLINFTFISRLYIIVNLLINQISNQYSNIYGTH